MADDPFVLGGTSFTSRLIMGTGVPQPRRPGARAGGLRHGTHDGRDAARRRLRARLGAVRPGAARHPGAAQHRGLFHGGRGRVDGAAGPGGSRDLADQTRSDRGRAHAAARSDRTPRRRRDVGRRRVHGAAVHERRSRAGAEAGGRRVCGDHAARVADRVGARNPQSAQLPVDHRARACAGDSGRGGGYGVRRGVRDGAGVCRCDACLGGDAGAGAGADGVGDAERGGGGAAGVPGGAYPRRHFAEASSPTTGVACLDPERPAF